MNINPSLEQASWHSSLGHTMCSQEVHNLLAHTSIVFQARSRQIGADSQEKGMFEWVKSSKELVKDYQNQKSMFPTDVFHPK